jgi:hypothetical protein
MAAVSDTDAGGWAEDTSQILAQCRSVSDCNVFPAGTATSRACGNCYVCASPGSQFYGMTEAAYQMAHAAAATPGPVGLP